MGGCVSQPPDEQPAAQPAKALNSRLADEINSKHLAWVKEAPKGTGVPSLFELSKDKVLQHVAAEDIEKLPVSDSQKGYLVASFDSESGQAKVDFTNDDRTISYQGKGYSTTLVRTGSMSAGRYAFSVFVDLSRIRSWMQVGVVTSVRKQKGCPQVFDGTPHPFRDGEIALRSDGSLLTGKTGGNDGPDMNKQDRAYDTGDIISAQVDLNTLNVEWFKNGQSVKEYTLEEGSYFPSVSLDNPKEQVSLLAFYGPFSR